MIAGHFNVNSLYCSRDWIKIDRLIQEDFLCDSIVRVMAQDIQERIKKEEKSILIGIDLEGMNLVSKIGVRLKMPFSYIISEKNINHNSQKDVACYTSEYTNIILVTDVVSSFETIVGIKSKYNIDDDKLFAIYTILYRNAILTGENIENIDLIKKTYTISDDFDRETIKKRNCKIKDSRCIAINKNS